MLIEGEEYLIKEADNFFPGMFHKTLEKSIFDGDHFFRFNNTITNKSLQQSNHDPKAAWHRHANIKETGAFVHVMDLQDQKNILLMSMVKKSISNHFGIHVKEFMRINITFYPPNPLYPDNATLTPHTDFKSPHKNLLYYVNNNDADTLFFNQKYIENQFINYSKQKIVHRITPKANKAVLFDGFIFHAGNVSKTHNRIILNMNFYD